MIGSQHRLRKAEAKRRREHEKRPDPEEPSLKKTQFMQTHYVTFQQNQKPAIYRPNEPSTTSFSGFHCRRGGGGRG